MLLRSCAVTVAARGVQGGAVALAGHLQGRHFEPLQPKAARTTAIKLNKSKIKQVRVFVLAFCSPPHNCHKTAIKQVGGSGVC